MTAQPENTTISEFSGLVPVSQDVETFGGGGDLSLSSGVASGRTTPPAYYKSREVAKLVFSLVVDLVTETKDKLRDIYVFHLEWGAAAVKRSGTETEYIVSIYPAGPEVTDFDPTNRKITRSQLDTLTNDIDDRYEIFLKSVPYFMQLESSVDQQGSGHPWHSMDVKMTRKAPLAWNAAHRR